MVDKKINNGREGEMERRDREEEEEERGERVRGNRGGEGKGSKRHGNCLGAFTLTPDILERVAGSHRKGELVLP